jgi:6-phosphogluconolactonase
LKRPSVRPLVSGLAVSRRALLKSAALAFAASASVQAQGSGPIYVYVGTYNPRGTGIYVYRWNPGTGNLIPIDVTTASNPSFLALDPSKRFLYAGNEIATGTVTAYAIDPATGKLTLLNMQTAGGSPAHLSVHPSGRYVLVANYGGSTVEVIRLMSNGTLGPVTDLIHLTGQLGPNTARQDAPHPHMILTDPSGRFILVNDLGLDKTFIYTLNLDTGKLTPNPAQPFAVAEPGSGPRHFVFSGDNRRVYSLNELKSTITVFNWNSSAGTLSAIQNISTLPDGFHGISTGGEIAIDREGDVIYSSNRGFDSIAMFGIRNSTGELSRAGDRWEWTEGETPRQFTLDPFNNFIYVGNQNTDNIVIFPLNGNGARLTPTGTFVPIGSPACILFRA